METIESFKRRMRISHLFFANDLLLFTEAGEDQVAFVKDGLRSFCKASGQKISFVKSLLFVSPNLSDQVAGGMCASMGIPWTLDMGCYLGHQLIHKGRNTMRHNRLLQRVKDRLEGWRTNAYQGVVESL